MKIIYCLLTILLLASVSCGKHDDKTPNRPSPVTGVEVQTLNITSSDSATYSDGATVPIQGYMVYVSPLPGYSTVDMVRRDVGLSKSVALSTIIPASGVWYLSASEYDSKGASGRSQNEIKIELRDDGKFYLL